MPCLHVAIVHRTGGSSSSNSSSISSCGGNSTGISYEHHAIFDRNNDEYIHVTTTGGNGKGHVVRTTRRVFESNSSKPRVVKQPANVQEALNIVARASAAVGNTWDYHVLSHNCEHFVNECWNPTQPPGSHQAGNVVASIGGSTVFGAIGGGAGSGAVAATITPIATVVTTTATESIYLFRLIPWGTVTTTSSATVMTGLPLGSVIGIGVLGGLAGAGLGGLIAYGAREVIYRQTARNAQLVPMAVYNKSNQEITVSLKTEDSPLSDALYLFRAGLGVGVMSLDIASNMSEELNPPTVTDSGDTNFVLTVSGNSFNQKTCRVRRGDVVTFDGRRLRRASRRPNLQCGICWAQPPNVILEPCDHWEFCEQCVLQVIAHNALCPMCRRGIQGYRK